MTVTWFKNSELIPPKTDMYLVSDGKEIRTALFDRDFAHAEFYKWVAPDHVYADYDESPGITLDFTVKFWGMLDRINLPKT